MKWREWFEEREDTSCYGYGSWKSLSKAERKAWKERNPKPFRANITKEEVLRLNAIVAKSNSNVFRLECRQTEIGSTWIIYDYDNDREYDFTDMSSW